jgi:protein-tyrosine-phosphatase
MVPSDLSIDLSIRARVHAALGEPIRLAIVDELVTSDRSPGELSRRFDLPGNLLAHHLDVLQRAGLIERHGSSGDRRRRYVRLDRSVLDGVVAAAGRPPRPAVFVCSRNSARSQLAAALWRARTGTPATSAGTHPAAFVHPGAIAAARRAGLDLGDARPSALGDDTRDITHGEVIVTVCDRAREELDPLPTWWHWSLPDPVEAGTSVAFDRVVAELEERISRFVPRTGSA